MRLLVLLACALALGMGRRPPEKTMDRTELPAVHSWSGGQCGVSSPGARVVSDAAAWEALWKEAFARPAPPVDFSRLSAVAVFVGLKRTGGWSAELLPAEDGGRVVPFRVKAPAAGGFVIQAFTQPYAVRLYPRPEGGLRTEERR